MGEVCWCVIMCDLLAGCSCFCAPGRVAGWVCLGVFPTWCSKAGADTGSMKTFNIDQLTSFHTIWRGHFNINFNLTTCMLIFSGQKL